MIRSLWTTLSRLWKSATNESNSGQPRFHTQHHPAEDEDSGTADNQDIGDTFLERSGSEHWIVIENCQIVHGAEPGDHLLVDTSVLETWKETDYIDKMVVAKGATYFVIGRYRPPLIETNSSETILSSGVQIMGAVRKLVREF